MYKMVKRNNKKQHHGRTWRQQWRRTKKCTFGHKKILKNTKKTTIISLRQYYFAYGYCCIIGHLGFFWIFFILVKRSSSVVNFFAQNGVCAGFNFPQKSPSSLPTKHTSCFYRHKLADCCVLILRCQPSPRENRYGKCAFSPPPQKTQIPIIFIPKMTNKLHSAVQKVHHRVNCHMG